MSLFIKTSLALSISLVFITSGKAQSFECPIPQGSPKQEAVISKALPTLEDFKSPSKIAPVIEKLKADKEGTVEIVNSLIASYCKLVSAQQGITGSEKDAAIRKFGLNITRQLFSISSENAIVLDIELAPEIVTKINTLAAANKTTPEKWVADKITTIVVE